MLHYLLRLGVHYQIIKRLYQEKNMYKKTHGANKLELINQLKQSEIALSTKTANAQHYEVPTDFFKYILGPRLKYSCCYYDNDANLAQAETNMLALYCQRAQLNDGQHILDLGCGWGSLSLYLAEKFPNAVITAVSNSASQKHYIELIANNNNYTNLTVMTADVNQLALSQSFDRVVSIEMFEHIRNYQQLLANIASWLKPNGKLFVHHFCHHHFAYPFNSTNSWLARNFFQDGLMPSEDLLLFFQNDLTFEQRWRVNGKHYSQTCYAWLNNLFTYKQQILALFRQHYDNNPLLRFYHWELFIRACAQLFAYRNGHEWFVTHYLLSV